MCKNSTENLRKWTNRKIRQFEFGVQLFQKELTKHSNDSYFYDVNILPSGKRPILYSDVVFVPCYLELLKTSSCMYNFYGEFMQMDIEKEMPFQIWSETGLEKIPTKHSRDCYSYTAKILPSGRRRTLMSYRFHVTFSYLRHVLP